MSGVCVLRADADSEMGTGHVTRLISLGTWWIRAGGDAYIVGAAPDGLRRRAIDRGIDWISDSHGFDESAASGLAALAHDRGAAWICVDGYKFGPEFVDAVRKQGARVLQFADGVSWQTYAADVLVDQNLFAERRHYSLSRTAGLPLAGSQFACLDPSYVPYIAGRRVTRDRAHTVLVTMGGADPGGATVLAVEALTKVKSFEVATVAVGASNSRTREIEDACAADPRLTVVRNTDRMADLMSGSDLAIAAAGTTTWELAALGVPALLAVTAANQAPIASAMEEVGAAASLGELQSLTAEHIADRARGLLGDRAVREQMSNTARSLVDGRGGERIITEMLRIQASMAS